MQSLGTAAARKTLKTSPLQRGNSAHTNAVQLSAVHCTTLHCTLMQSSEA